MKIISLVAENVKKLVAVEIAPDGNVVEITGRNGQGKTSVLDSIWWALAGTKHIQAAPIRKGANEATIELSLGEDKKVQLRVIRSFRRKNDTDDYTTSIAVESADGGRFPSPQTMIDALLGELSFDPLKFARLGGNPEGRRKQLEILRKFVPDVDFDAIDRQNKGDRDRRTEVNRFVEQERAAAKAIVTPPDTPTEPIDKGALVAELDAAGKSNEELVQRRANRDRMATQIATNRRAIEADKARCDELLKEIQAIRDRALRLQADTDAMQEKLDGLPPLPAAIETAPIVARIKVADAVNDNVRKLDERMKHTKRAMQLEDESAQITARLKDREEAKRAAISAAKMPIAGLGFGEDTVLLNGVPFDQASDAEQLRASVAIAAALNPKLRVIRIRDGSLLDDGAMKWLAQFAAELDMQIWIERVDSSGTVGFVLEDGHVRKPQRETEGAAA